VLSRLTIKLILLAVTDIGDFKLARIYTYKVCTMNTYVTYQKLTPWDRVLIENIIVTQLVKKLPAFYGTRRFITKQGVSKRASQF
jgi:hypothetical protein